MAGGEAEIGVIGGERLELEDAAFLKQHRPALAR